MSDSDLQAMFTDAESDIVRAMSESGFVGDLAAVTLKRRPLLLRSLRLHSCLLSVKAEIDQLMDGLSEVFGVLSLIRQSPSAFKRYFCFDDSERLTAGMLRSSVISINSKMMSRKCFEAVHLNEVQQQGGRTRVVEKGDCYLRYVRQFSGKMRRLRLTIYNNLLQL